MRMNSLVEDKGFVTEMTKDAQDDKPSSEGSTDEGRRKFLLMTTSVIGGAGALCALTPLVSSWMPSAMARAEAAPVQVDLSQMKDGQQVTVPWRGKPVWIIRRSPEMLRQTTGHADALRDPDSLVEQQPKAAQNAYRSLRQEYLVLIGICTHLGCVPKYEPEGKALGADWPGGFFCPCHGSKFDLSGRVFKGAPAPVNLEVPPYYFLDDQTIVIGESQKKDL